MERAGTSDKGSITAIYAVLVDGGDFDEPIADAAYFRWTYFIKSRFSSKKSLSMILMVIV